MFIINPFYLVNYNSPLSISKPQQSKYSKNQEGYSKIILTTRLTIGLAGVKILCYHDCQSTQGYKEMQIVRPID